MLPLNGYLAFDGTTMDYIRFGHGRKNLIILPGLGDGLRTVRGTAIPMSLVYGSFGKDYTVYSFSRKNQLQAGCTTRDMARDLAKAMELLNIPQADFLGVSMGGMIVQQLAREYPEKVGRLVLAVTCARPNEHLTRAVALWEAMARQGDNTALMDSNVRMIYSEEYYRKNKWLVPIMGKITKPKSYERFLIQAEACRTHDCFDCLGKITAPTLVIGGELDQILGSEPSREVAGQIPNAALKIYPQWGHGLYEEAKDFLPLVREFLQGKTPSML